MPEVKWIKITTDMFDDEKIKLIEGMPDKDSILIIWIKLLTLAGKINANGYIFLTANIPYTTEMLATVFNRPLNTVRLAFETFKNFGMIEIDENNLISIPNWTKHQNVNGLDRIREQNRLRQQNKRERTKLLLANTDNVTSRDSHVKSHDFCSISNSYSNTLSNTILDNTVVVDEAETKPKTQGAKKTKAKEKNSYAEYVSLTEAEYSKLVSKYGEQGTQRMIEIINNFKGANNKTYASDYHAILSWVVGRYEEEQSKKTVNKEEKRHPTDFYKVYL